MLRLFRLTLPLPRLPLLRYDGIARSEIKLKGDAKTVGASAAIVPDLDEAHLRRLRAKFRSLRTAVWTVVRLQRLSRLSANLRESSRESAVGSSRRSECCEKDGMDGEGADAPSPSRIRRQLSSPRLAVSSLWPATPRGRRIVVKRRSPGTAAMDASESSLQSISLSDAALSSEESSQSASLTSPPELIRRHSSFEKRPRAGKLLKQLSGQLSRMSGRSSSGERESG